jgi:hypothetical protein
MHSINSFPVRLRTEYETQNSENRSTKLYDNLCYYIMNADGGSGYCVVVRSVRLSVQCDVCVQCDVSPHFKSIVE